MRKDVAGDATEACRPASSLAIALEPRFMFDAASAATAAEAARDLAAHDAAAQPAHGDDGTTDPALAQAAATLDADAAPQPDATPAAVAPEPPRKEVVFIDTSVADWQTLRDSVPAGAEIVLLDGARDGLDQMAAWAEGKQGYDAIHLLSHGGDGFVSIGTTTLDRTAIADRSADLAALGGALADTGDILLYGCAVGGGEAGRAFTTALASATGADVAASDDATGASALGGDWTLETHAGTVDTTSLAASSYGRVLADVITGYTPGSAGDVYTNPAYNTSVPYAQSFTATKTGEIASISFGAQGITGTVTVTIRDGDGTGGAVLYSKNITSGTVETSSLNGVQHFTYTIDSAVGITAGNRYTICYSSGIEGHALVTGNRYSGGTLYEAGSAISVYDTAFRVVQRDPVLSQPVVDLNGNSDGIDTTATATEGSDAILFPQAEVRAGTGGTHAVSMVIAFDGRPDGTSESLTLGSTGIDSATMGGLSVVYDPSAGTLTISGTAPYGLYQNILQDVRYTSPLDTPTPGPRTLRVTISDSSTTSAAAAVTLTVNAVNDAPTATGSGNNVTFTEDGPDTGALFALSAVDPVETNQGLASVRISASNIADGANEGLVLNSNYVAFSAGTHTVGGHTVTIAQTGAGAYTVSIAFGSPLSATDAQTFLNAITYRNTNTADPATSTRTFTLDRITDDGGTANGGVDQKTLSISASVAVVRVNDAPTLTNGATVTLSGTTEDTTSGATTVGALLSGAGYADGDTVAAKGIAVTGSTGGGTWQFSPDGTTWTNIGTASNSNALLLDINARIRYVPDGANAETATLAFRAWDKTNGAAPGSRADSTTNGGTSAFSSATASASLAVTAVNDAPTLTDGATVTLPGTTEDAPATASVSSLLAGASYADVDSGAAKGIAVTGTTGNGTWQFSTNGTTWTDFGAVSGGSALLLTSAMQVRYVPDGANGETPTLAFRAWDQSSGTAGSKAATTTNGGTSAFSTATASASLAVTAVNDAPTLTNGATVTLPGTTEDSPATASVSSLLTGAGHGDVDSGAAKGIAVTGTTGNGTWLFSTDGTTWTDFGAVSSGSALLLTSAMQVRYVPDGSNAETASLAFRAWDQTSGTAGTKAATTTNGGTSAFSTATATASLAVSDANDAPVLTPAAPTLTPITEDDLSNDGQTVASVLGTSVSDADTGAVAGIAVTGLVSSTGTWQFSLDNGTTWTAMGSVSDGAARLLRATDRIRFVPDGRDGTTASLTYRAWDQTTGTAGGLGDTSSPGGSSAFSTARDTASISVTAINDAPTASQPTLPDSTAVAGQAYRFDIPTGWFTDAEPGPLTLSARDLPPGLNLVDGALVGTFGSAGSLTVQIVATDGGGKEAVSTLTIRVATPPAPPAPTSSEPPAPAQNSPVRQGSEAPLPAFRRDNPFRTPGLPEAPPPELPLPAISGGEQPGGAGSGGLLPPSSPLAASGTPVATGIGTLADIATYSGGFGGIGPGISGFSLEDAPSQDAGAPAFTASLAALHGTFDKEAQQLAQALGGLEEAAAL